MILADCGLNFGFTTTCLYSSNRTGLISSITTLKSDSLFTIDSFFLKGIIAILRVLWTLQKSECSTLSHVAYSLGSGAQKKNATIIIMMMFFFTLSPPFSNNFNLFQLFSHFYFLLCYTSL